MSKMISSIFKNSNIKTSAISRGPAFGSSQNSRNSNKKPHSQYNSNSYIDLGWISNLVEKFDNVGRVTYQIVALGLLTLGLILAFQNFSNLRTSENVVVINKAQIARSEEKRIWTDTASIDKTQDKYNFNITTAPVIQVATINSECEKVTLVANTQFSSDQIDKCSSKVETTASKTTKKNTPAVKLVKTIKVEAGENLSYLAKTNKVSVAQIIDLNNLKSNNLKLGQTLIIPLDK